MAVPPILEATLRQYGLLSLLDWATQAIVQNWSEDQIMLEMFKRPEFRKRFPAIFSLEANGRPPISVDEYLQYEKTAAAMSAQWDITLSKDQVDALIAGEVAPTELESRFDLAAEVLYESSAEDVGELQRFSGVTAGDMMLYIMNPKKGLGELQTKWRQATIAGAALRTGWGQLTQAQAERLQQVGIAKDEAQQGFGELAKMDELFSPFDVGESEFTRDRQIEFLAGDVDAALEIERRMGKRKAEFAGGGGFASGESGFAVGSQP